MSEWISWLEHPVPEDVKGILIKYTDGVFSDRYDYETGKRKYREGQAILGWKFMERRDPSIKTIRPIVANECRMTNKELPLKVIQLKCENPSCKCKKKPVGTLWIHQSNNEKFYWRLVENVEFDDHYEEKWVKHYEFL